MIAPWVTVDDLVDPLSPFAEDAAAAASFVLWNLSGRKYGGVGTVTEEYCQVGLSQIGLSSYYGPNGRPPLPGPSGYPFYPELRYGVITNRAGGICSDCGCTHLLRLRGGPVIAVTKVRVGGNDLDPSSYAVYDYSFIASPNACWRTCDDVEVTYSYGAPPPVMGRMAAKALADQYILAMSGSDECELPQRVTQVSRQGMSWTLLDPQEFLDKGRTGIYQVDLFLTAVNPDNAKLRPRVFSPDVPRARAKRTTIADPGPTVQVFTAGATTFSVPGPMLSTPQAMSVQTAVGPTAPISAPTGTLTAYSGRPLRWVVPGAFTEDHPPRIVVRPSGEAVPTDALMWRNGNYTLDLTGEQVERLLPDGSVLAVSPTADGSSTAGEASYLVERRTL